MKKIITITFCFVLFGISNVFSQTVNDIPIKDIDVEYIQIVESYKAFSSKLTVEVDFGQENKLFSAKTTEIKGKDGKRVEFNGLV